MAGKGLQGRPGTGGFTHEEAHGKRPVQRQQCRQARTKEPGDTHTHTPPSLPLPHPPHSEHTSPDPSLDPDR